MENDSKQGINNFKKKLVTEPWLEKYANTGSGWLIIVSGSMAPLIQAGDQILVKKIAPSQIQLGDIITFWQGNILVTHRVIRRQTKSGNICFVEKGDANANYSWIDAQSIIGKVRKIKKGEREIDIDTLLWKTFNRTIGIGLLCALALRAAGRRMPGVPEWSKNLVRRAFAIFAWFKNKTLRALLHQ
jgi:signal peptidase I